MPSVIPQPVDAQLTRAAIFLVVTVQPGPEHRAAVRALCGNPAALVRAVGFRDLDGRLSCVLAFGSEAWDRLFGPSATFLESVAAVEAVPPPAGPSAGAHRTGNAPESPMPLADGSLKIGSLKGGPGHE